jgi:DNA-binding transcriptional MerR regulator
MPAPLLTLRAIAHALRLPESTVRYYRDAFAEFLPTEGRGRRRRHPAAVLPLFELIAEGFAVNWSRNDIRAALAERRDGAPPPASPPAPAGGPAVVLRRSAEPADEVLALVLDGERDRREALWHMAREIVRLGEAVERQHAVLSEIARQLERRAAPRLPAAERAPEAPDELGALRTELARERELVERLRRSKLEIERRAAEAEAALSDTRDGGLRRMFGGRPRPDTS